MKNTRLFIVLSSIIFSICFVLSDTKIASADYPAVYGGYGVSTATFANIEVSGAKMRIKYAFGNYGSWIDLVAGPISQKSKTQDPTYGTSFELESLNGNIRFTANNEWISAISGGQIGSDMQSHGTSDLVMGVQIGGGQIRAWSWAYPDNDIPCMDGFCYGSWINLGYFCPSGGTLSGTTCITPPAPTCTASWNLPGPLTAPGTSNLVLSGVTNAPTASSSLHILALALK